MRDPLLSLYIASILSITLGSGCRGDPSPGSETVSTLTVLHPGDEGIFGPDWPAKFLVFLPLAERDEGGRPQGVLASRWERSADWRTWTIHLRPGLKWHDGAPVTAHDARFTLDLLAHPAVGYTTPDAHTVTVLDDSTYTITFRKRSWGSPYDYWTVYWPKHLLEGLDPAEFWQWEFWTRPVGNGPYRFVQRVPHTMVELSADSTYFRGRPRIERLILKTGRDYGDETAMTDLLAGQADAVLYVNPTELLKIDRNPRFRAYHTIDPDNLSALAFNLRRPPFDDVRVRRAVALAIDRRTLFASMNLPSGLPIVDGPTDFDHYLAGEVGESIPHDPAAAARLLDAAGWRDADGDGIREKAGRRLAFEVLTSEWQQASRAAVLLQSQLARVGARVEIVPVELQVQRERVLAGRFDAAVVMVAGPLNDDVLFGADSPLGYRSRRAAALVERIEAALDRDERARLQGELIEVLSGDLPAVFLYPAVWSFVADRRVQGLSSPWRADPVRWADRLWIEDEPR